MITGKQAEKEAVLATAKAMCQAARTAPKTKGLDYIVTGILTGEEKEQFCKEMNLMAEKLGLEFFNRDAQNVSASEVVVLIGHKNVVRGLNEACQYCGFENCKVCLEQGGRCAYISMDLGIAVGSAVSVAADARVDNRVMFSVGRTALEMNILGKDVCQVLGIPLSVSGKSPYFDRK